MSTALWPATTRLVAALNTVYGTGEHETAIRLMKVVEEASEAVAAHLGMTGQSLRKGTTHTRADVAEELCDVIIAAAVALHSFSDAAPAVLDAKLRAATRRLSKAEVWLTAWPTPDDAYATAPSIVREIGWTAAAARTASSRVQDDGVGREYWLRKAALLDRIALSHEAQGVPNGSDDVAANAARQLTEADRDGDGDYYGDPYGPEDPATLAYPRGYVRQEYARWAQNQ